MAKIKTGTGMKREGIDFEYAEYYIYLLKVNNRNTRPRCEICSKLTIRTPERRHGVVND